MAEAATEAKAAKDASEAERAAVADTLAALRSERDSLQQELEQARAEQTEALTSGQSEIDTKKAEIGKLSAIRSDLEAELSDLEQRRAAHALEVREIEERLLAARALLSPGAGVPAEGATGGTDPVLQPDQTVPVSATNTPTRTDEAAGSEALVPMADQTGPVTVSVAPSSATATGQEQSARTPRSPADVLAALDVAPGLPDRDSPQRERLRDMLVEGACATDALRASMGTINRQALLSLIETLGGC